MSLDYNLITILVGYVVFRELMFFYQLNKLVNKLMSRNFYDYMVSDSVTKEVLEPKPRVQMEDESSNALAELNSML